MKEVKKGVWIAEEDPLPFIKIDLNKAEDKKYKNKEWLYDQYWNKGKSTCKIANEQTISTTTVLSWMMNFGIPRRTKSKALKGHNVSKETKEKLRKKALNKKHSEETKRRMSESHKGKIGKLNSNWKGGKYKKRDGYWYIRKPGHHRSSFRGYVAEHIFNAEIKLGRPIKKTEVVHHINFDRGDNRLKNLDVLKSKAEHGRVHNNIKELLKELFNKDIIYYNFKTQSYEIK